MPLPRGLSFLELLSAVVILKLLCRFFCRICLGHYWQMRRSFRDRACRVQSKSPEVHMEHLHCHYWRNNNTVRRADNNYIHVYIQWSTVFVYPYGCRALCKGRVDGMMYRACFQPINQTSFEVLLYRVHCCRLARY